MNRVVLVAFALVTGTFVGIVVGLAFFSAYYCALGGSADPRCATGWRGYVEVHQLEHGRAARISCVYRPWAS